MASNGGRGPRVALVLSCEQLKFSGHDFCWAGRRSESSEIINLCRFSCDTLLFLEKRRGNVRKDVITSKRIIRSQAPTRTSRRKKTTNDTAIKRIGAHWRCLRTVLIFLDPSTKKTRQSLRATRGTDRIVYFADSFRVAT